MDLIEGVGVNNKSAPASEHAGVSVLSIYIAGFSVYPSYGLLILGVAF